MGPLSQSLVAWLLLPAVMYALCLGLGLLASRIARVRPPAALLPPLGLSVALVAGLPSYRLDTGAWLPAVLLAGGALAGFVLSRRELRERANPGAAGAAALVVLVLYLAPVVLAGGWTWTGYNFVNDTALQLQLVDHLGDDGFEQPASQETAERSSTSDAAVYFYQRAYYPVGAHALLATVKTLVPAPTAALYQPFLAMLCALGAMALAVLARRLLGSAVLAAAAAAVATASNLLYAYALQGNIKEMATFAALATAAVLGRELLADLRAGPAVLFALSLTAILAVFSSAGAPYVLALGGLVLAVALWRPPFGDRRRLRGPALAGAATLLLAGALAATELIDSFRVISDAFGSSSAAPGSASRPDVNNSPLGHLLRPLLGWQLSGVWLGTDYRVPVGESTTLVNTLAIGAVLAMAAAGTAYSWLRREGALLLLAVPALAAVALVGPRVSPYAEAKLLAIASPAVVLLAAAGVVALGRLRRPLGYALAALLAAAVLASDAYSYHGVQLAPIDRMRALEDVAERYEGRGELVFTEFEEFAKYFMKDAAVISSFDPVSPRQVQLRQQQSYIGRVFDLDEQRLAFVEAFPFLVQRKGPDASRPPANFRADYENRYYRVWRRGKRPRVLEHLPLQRFADPTATPDCAEVERLAARARGGERLVAARRPPPVVMRTRDVRHSPGWVDHPFLEGNVVTNTPGAASASVRVPPGRFRTWVQGSFGRPISVYSDGRLVGRVKGVNTIGAWQLAGTLTSSGGRMRLELRRGGGGLAPGDGYRGALGPLALEPVAVETLVSLPARDARSLCGRRWDWIERVGPVRPD